MLSPVRWPNMIRRIAVWICQLLIISVALWFAFVLRFDLRMPAGVGGVILIALPVWMLAKSAVFRLLGLDRGWWFHISAVELLLLFAGNVVASLVCFSAVYLISVQNIPRSIYILDGVLCFLLSAGVRALSRLFRDRRLLFRRGA